MEYMTELTALLARDTFIAIVALDGARKLGAKILVAGGGRVAAEAEHKLAVGRDLFDPLLDKEHGLSLRAKDLVAIGEHVSDTERRAAEVVARGIGFVVPGMLRSRGGNGKGSVD